ncbi:MAG TPA: MFS transporter [Actinomycetota bacterium]|nr:MFS transporter [Actinomycetota bacterium]
MIDLRLFRAPAFGASLLTITLALFAAFGAFLFLAQYLQLVLGLSPIEAGLWTLPSSFGLIVGSVLAPLLVRWVNPSVAIAGGMVVAAVGFGVLTQVDETSGLALAVFGSVVFALGVAPVILATDLVVSTAPPQRAGAASALAETSSEFGGALGIAVLGSIGTAVYRGEVTDNVPAGVPPEAATTATDTIEGAVAVADDLPDQLGAELLEAARAAFTQGFRLTAAIAAALALGVAILVARLLRGVQPSSDHEPESEPEQSLVAAPQRQ